jgi:cell wall-active antibiotic response 4TMS protein YvqF
VKGGGIDWTRVSGGLYLVGFGTFLLLTTHGYRPWSFWIDALAFWPVLLVAVGLRLIFERSRAPWAVLLSPILVLGTLTYVATRRPGSRIEDWAFLRAERPAGADHWTFKGNLAMVDLDLEASPLPRGLFVEGRAAPGEAAGVRLRPDLRVHPGKGDIPTRVRLRSGGLDWPVSVFRSRPGRYDLKLARDLPLDLDFGLAFARARLDLASAPVSGFDLNGAFNDLTLRLGPPKSDVRLDLHGAFNQVRVEVPPSTPVRSSAHGLLNVIDGRPGAASLQGPGYRLNLDGAFNRVVIRSD